MSLFFDHPLTSTVPFRAFANVLLRRGLQCLQAKLHSLLNMTNICTGKILSLFSLKYDGLCLRLSVKCRSCIALLKFCTFLCAPLPTVSSVHLLQNLENDPVRNESLTSIKSSLVLNSLARSNVSETGPPSMALAQFVISPLVPIRNWVHGAMQKFSGCMFHSLNLIIIVPIVSDKLFTNTFNYIIV